MEAIVTALGIFLASLILAMVPALLLWRWDKAPQGWRYAALLSGHALVCTLLVLLLNGFPGFFGENAGVYAKLDAFAGKGAVPEQHFILIDNSGNKQLVLDPNGNLEDSTVRVLTDRARLARLLQLLAAHQAELAQVVVDIAFTDPSPSDSVLREAVLDLAAHQKILLARSAAENTPVLQFGSDVMADVTEYKQEDLIAWHTTARGSGHSLPYELYLRLDDSEAEPFTFGLWKEHGVGGTRLVYHGFMPSWQYLPGPGTGEVRSDELAMPIGHALDVGWDRLTRQFKTAKGERKAVVFIGEFPEMADEGSSDQHRTFLGKTTGSAMLIDLYHELDEGAHVLNGITLFVLFAALFLCSWWVFSRAWPLPQEMEAMPHTFGAIVWKYVKDAGKELIPVGILIITAWVLLCTGQLMNLPPLLIYFLVLISLVKAIRKARATEPSAADEAPPTDK